MVLSSLSKIATAWNIMWALSYICVAILAPEISDAKYGAALYTFIGCLIFIALALWHIKVWSTRPIDLPGITAKFERIQHYRFRWLGQALFAFLGCLMVYSGVASWTGVAMWNVPFVDRVLFQVSMAFADLISAVFMLVLVFEDL